MTIHGRPAFAKVTAAIGTIIAAACVAVPAEEKEPLSFIDPTDRQLDMSDFLLKHKGALPVPIVITEPAVGYGVGLGLLFFSGPIAEEAANSTGD